MKDFPGYQTTVYEEDLENISGGDPRFKYRRTEIKGSTYRIRPNPGRRPKRKPGESPLDPPSE